MKIKDINERNFQREILDYLKDTHGYIERYNNDFDRGFNIDRELLMRFLWETQPKTMDKLKATYPSDLEQTLVAAINKEIQKSRSSLLQVLKNGLEINRNKIVLMYQKPATTLNRDMQAKYDANILSVTEELWVSDAERIDIVISLNGIPVMATELKSNLSGQNVNDAIAQYRTSRSPKTRLFQFKAGVLVCFAMDENTVSMTTQLKGTDTYFLPFNRGNGEPNSPQPEKNVTTPTRYGTAYMWETIWSKDMLIDIIAKFMFIKHGEKLDELNNKTVKTESIIFPRFHQLDCVTKLIDDVNINKTSENYLIQHSAGSGKSNTIAWLAHRLSTLHDADNKPIFDNVIIMTDRVVVDRQLQKTVTNIAHKSGLIKVMDDKCTSKDLAKALASNTKIIASTIQKFQYILDSVDTLKDKKFAVIIDEAHSSTAGKAMSAVNQALSDTYDEDETGVDDESVIEETIRRYGKQNNVATFGFTATPKPTTINMFGRTGTDGYMGAFHTYSMQQAINEGFILDVLTNYTEYKTMYRINKDIDDDPELKVNQAKRLIARYANLHETNISQRVSIIIEHFTTKVAKELDGKAKAMVVTGSREEAVRYFKAFRKYIEEHAIDNIEPLVAYSGKLKVDSEEYSESSLNGFSEDKTQSEFDTDKYQVLLVANKYQTGFDQPKLCAMYILKKLSGVNAVQTLSRLNRICPPYAKKTFILDFVNTHEEMVNHFSPYYTTTILSETVTPGTVYELDMKIDSFDLFGATESDRVYEITSGDKISKKDKKEINDILQTANNEFNKHVLLERVEMLQTLRRFVRYYDFLLLVSEFSDVELHKRYTFITYVLDYLKINDIGTGFSLKDKIQASGFEQHKGDTYTKTELTGKNDIKLPISTQFKLTEEEEVALSEIIKDINSKLGKNFDSDQAATTVIKIKETMASGLNEEAKANNLDDFISIYNDNIDKAINKNYKEDREFYKALLDHPDIKKEVLGIFAHDVYNQLRKKK